VRAVIVKDEKCAREWPREKKKVIELIDEVVLVRCPKTRWRKILEKMDSGARKVVREALGTWYDYRGNFGRVGISHAAASRGMDGSRGGGREGYKECPQWRNRSPSPRLGGWGGGTGKEGRWYELSREPFRQSGTEPAGRKKMQRDNVREGVFLALERKEDGGVSKSNDDNDDDGDKVLVVGIGESRA